MTKFRPASLLLASILAAASFAAPAQDALLKPVPTPDASKLPADAQAEIKELRRLFDEAKAALVGPPLADAFAKLGAVYARYGFYDASKAALENAIALSPYDGRYFYLQGVFAQQAKRMPEARKLFQQAYDLDRAYLPIRYRLAEAQLQLNELDAAKQTLAEVAQKRTDLAPAPALLGQIALKQKNWGEAVRQLELALKADPSATSLYGPLADAYAGSGDGKRAQEARAKVGSGIASFADPLVQGVYATATVEADGAALALAGSGRHDEARKMLDAALEAAPDNARLLAASARIEADAGNAALARTRADAALAADATGAVPKLARAVVAEISGQESQAVSYYEQAVRADLGSVEARLLLGNAYMRRQAYPAAAEQYRAMVAAAPADGGAYARLAAAETMSGRCGAALETVDAAATAQAKNAGIGHVLVRLASTCAAATAEQKARALATAKALYEQRGNADDSEAYALALAANGKAADAVEYQAAVLFEAAKSNDQAAIARGRTYLQQFEANKAATQPWPPGHPLYTPPRLAPSAKLAAKPAPPPDATN